MRPVALPPHSLAADFDVTRRYVRLREMRDDGFVLFDFAIGDPDLSVELMLPQSSFGEFCREQQVVWITQKQGETLDRQRLRWSQGFSSQPQEETP